MRILFAPDANTDSASSTESENKRTESSPTKGKSVTDIVMSTFAKHNDGSADDEEGQNSSVRKSDETNEDETDHSENVDTTVEGEHTDETEETTKSKGSENEEAESSEAEGETETESESEENKDEEGEGEESEEHEEKEEDDESKPPPFHTHPRWKKMVAERDELKQQLALAGQDVESYRSITDFLSAHDVTNEQFQQAVQIAAALNTDPAKAREMLEPIWKQLAGDGKLPADLAKEVENGVLTQSRAEEIARLRGESKLREESKKRREALQVREREMAFLRDVQKSLMTWTNQKKVKDTKFQPKPNKSDPDGKYEWFLTKLDALFKATPPKTPQEAVQLAERAYADVGSVFKLPAAQPPKRRVPPSSQSTTKTSAGKQPNTIRGIALKIAAKHGVV